ncbi:MAG: hypothetical protein SVK08_02125 [Halobacteriota archaeon]|nr:hypothetical protein [Halobacteriota archaeon]
MRETKRSSILAAELRKVSGCYAKKINDRYEVGVPDIIGCYHGMMFAFEVKVRLSSGSLAHKFTPAQVIELKQLKKSSALAVGLVYDNKTRLWSYVEPEWIKNGEPEEERVIDGIKDYLRAKLENHFSDSRKEPDQGPAGSAH